MENNLNLNNYFTVFGIEIYYYALTMVGGMLFAALCWLPILKRRGFKTDFILDLLIAIIPLSIVFARLGWVVFSLDKIESFWDVFNTRNGGMSIYGGIVGGALGLFILSKIKHISFFKLADLAAAVLPLGQAIGRLGNFFNQEVYGKVVTDSNLQWTPMSVFIEKTGDWHYALCFYEMFFSFLIFAFLYLLLFRYKGRRNGYVFALYLILYGTVRAIMEPMREEEFQLVIGGVKAMWLISLILIVIGAALFGFLLVKDIQEKNYWWKDLFKKSDKKVAVEAVSVSELPPDLPDITPQAAFSSGEGESSNEKLNLDKNDKSDFQGDEPIKSEDNKLNETEAQDAGKQ